MELFLNLLCLAIALGALCARLINCAFQERRTSSNWLHEWISLSCALIFVFFAVSISDDLNASAILYDDYLIGRQHSLAWNPVHSSYQHPERPQMSAAVAPSQFIFSANLPLAEWTSPAVPHVYHGLKETSLLGRSPPPFFTPDLAE